MILALLVMMLEIQTLRSFLDIGHLDDVDKRDRGKTTVSFEAFHQWEVDMCTCMIDLSLQFIPTFHGYRAWESRNSFLSLQQLSYDRLPLLRYLPSSHLVWSDWRTTMAMLPWNLMILEEQIQGVIDLWGANSRQRRWRRGRLRKRLRIANTGRIGGWRWTGCSFPT